MKLETFTDVSMPRALARVKSRIGSNAVIVSTRSFKRGGVFGIGTRQVVEIVARRPSSSAPSVAATANPTARRLRQAYAFTPNSVGSVTAPPSSDQLTPNRATSSTRKRAAGAADRIPAAIAVPQPVLDAELKSEIAGIRQVVENLVTEQRRHHAPQMPEKLFDVYVDLIQREVGEELARELIADVQKQMTGNQIASPELVRQKVTEAIDAMVATAGPICRNLNGAARVVALIGPTGVGKTTTIAKLAADFKLRQNKKVGLITIDTYRIAAVEQLRTYAQIIDVPLKVVVSPSELKRAIDLMADMDLILIDTAGRAQTDTIKLNELKAFLDAASPDEVHLVLSSTAHHTHMLSAAEEFAKIGVDRLILTKLDEAISFGVVLSVMQKVKASLSYITTGQDVPDDIEVGNGRRVAQMILGAAAANGAPALG